MSVCFVLLVPMYCLVCRTSAAPVDLYSRAASSDGLLCIRKVCQHGLVPGEAYTLLPEVPLSNHTAPLTSALHGGPSVSCHMLIVHVFWMQYWDSHCSSFSKVPTLAVLQPGSCPKGLAPALFLELLSRLTDLQQWQIWDLLDTLDINSCGFVSA